MTSTATYGTTGNAYVDGVLSGIKWGVTSLTFSFPSSASFYGTGYPNGEPQKGFEAFTAQQQAAVREVLKMYASVSNLTFTELTESSSVHAELRYAESDTPSTAWAYYPSTNTVGGDAWFNNSKAWYDAPSVGNYAWLTMIHETGHALGLKHPHEASGAFGALPVDKDSLEYSVMSYRSYVGASTTTGYTNGSTSFPQTLMMYDIAAIQKMYGANYTTNAGDTVYSWNAGTGQMSLNGVGQATPGGNKVFMTLWDGGGNDTYSFAGYTTGVTVDLNPGGWTTSSAAQLAALGSGKVAIGNIANALLFNGNTASLIENAIGGSGADKLSGNTANNKFTGGAGNDVLDGRDGTDTAVYSGKSTDYSWLHNSDDRWTITDLRGGAPDGVDTLRNIELLQFTDQTMQIGTAPIVVTPPPVVNAAPIVANDAYSTGKNGKLTVNASNGVLKNDVDPEHAAMTATLVSGPSRGSLSFKTDGSFVYTPSRNFTGTVSFTYKAKDGTNTSTTATVTIAVGVSAAKGKGGLLEHGSMTEDQMPAPAHTGHGTDWHSDVVVQAIARAALQIDGSNPADMLHHLNDVVSQLGIDPFGHTGGGGHGNDLDLGGLPDFLKAYSSEFVLF